MSKILIAVGGTGQEIALACLRLCHMAWIEIPTVLVIDSDQASGQAGFRTRSEELQLLGDSLKEIRGTSSTNEFLRPLAGDISSRDVTTLRGLFSPAQVTSPEVQDVLSLLFTTAQQETRIIDGFHGEPAVGSVAFEDYMRQGDFEERVLKRLDDLTATRVPHLVVLAGSTTGGTGPGVIPALSRRILEWRGHLDPPRHVEVSGVVQLQWFQPEKDGAVSWSSPPDINLHRLQRNSACLVRQYDAQLAKLLDRLVLLSLPDVIQRVSTGPNHQPETLHWLNVLSGWMVTRLLDEGQVQGLARGEIYGYALDVAADPLALLSFFHDGVRILLQGALDSTRILAALGTALSRQMGSLRLDPALPAETYRFMRAVRKSEVARSEEEKVRDFLTAFGKFAQVDQSVIDWFREACASRLRPWESKSPRDPKDIRGAFSVPPTAFMTEIGHVGKLLKKPQALEQDYVAALLDAAGSAHQRATPEAIAITLYRNLRRILFESFKERI